jgi:hypothetical protein
MRLSASMTTWPSIGESVTFPLHASSGGTEAIRGYEEIARPIRVGRGEVPGRKGALHAKPHSGHHVDRGAACGVRGWAELCASFRRGGCPGAFRSISPAGPSVLNRSTQSRTTCRVTQPALAASVRLPPS